MKGEARTLEFLNKALGHELRAVNQFWLHYRMLESWGVRRLGQKWRQESIEEMWHADRLIDRLLFLEGQPNMQTDDHVHVGQDVQRVLEYDLALEVEARLLYQEAAGHCQSIGDFPTRDLFEKLMADEEKHIDFLETQMEAVKRIGIERYTQAHLGELEGDKKDM